MGNGCEKLSLNPDFKHEKIRHYIFSYLQGYKLGKELDVTIKKYTNAVKSQTN